MTTGYVTYCFMCKLCKLHRKTGLVHIGDVHSWCPLVTSVVPPGDVSECFCRSRLVRATQCLPTSKRCCHWWSPTTTSCVRVPATPPTARPRPARGRHDGGVAPRAHSTAMATVTETSPNSYFSCRTSSGPWVCEFRSFISHLRAGSKSYHL